MNSKLLLGLVVIVAGVGIGWYIIKGSSSPSTSTPTPTPEIATETVAPSPEATAVKVTVTYGDNGFAPNTITVKKDTTVHFVNNASVAMWVASAVHPTHQLLPGFDELASVDKGGSYDYTFTKVGTWKYHNHIQASDTGTVIVTE